MIIPRRKPYFAPKTFNKIVKLFFSKNKDNQAMELEKALTDKLNIPNPVAVESGRVGFYLILKHANLKKGAEIIMPGLTFGLMKDVILKAGFKPIPVDSDIESFQMSPKEIEKVITPKTGAILASHMFGNPCDIKTIKSIATKNKLLLIEDCAESLGATVGGKLTGTFGDIAFSSFNIAKPLQGIGGGLVFGNDIKLIQKIRKDIHNANMEPKIQLKEIIRSLVGYVVSRTYIWPLLMYLVSFNRLQKIFVCVYRSTENMNYNLNSISPYYAFIVKVNISSFRKRSIKRSRIIKYYKHMLPASIPLQIYENEHSGNGYMIATYFPGDVNKLRRFLSLRCVDIGIKNEVADNCLNKDNSNTNTLAKNLISLPIYENLSKKDVSNVCNYLYKYLSTESIH